MQCCLQSIPCPRIARLHSHCATVLRYFPTSGHMLCGLFCACCCGAWLVRSVSFSSQPTRKARLVLARQDHSLIRKLASDDVLYRIQNVTMFSGAWHLARLSRVQSAAQLLN